MTIYFNHPLLLIFLISTNALFAQKDQIIAPSTSVFSFDTTIIQSTKYTGLLNSKGFFLLNSKLDTVLKHGGDYFDFIFRDFNKDGFKDIFLDHGGNTPDRYSLLVYLPSSKRFKEIKDFEHFPAPEHINGTNYYYSYHKSGCADMNWDSDLFYINNFTAIRIGNISGRECNNSGIKDAIYIQKNT